MCLGRGVPQQHLAVGSLPTAGFDSLAQPGGPPAAGMIPPGSALRTPRSKTALHVSQSLSLHSPPGGNSKVRTLFSFLPADALGKVACSSGGGALRESNLPKILLGIWASGDGLS